MINHTRILITDETNPHVNLAREEALLKSLPDGQAMLFLWQNAHTVVVGAGQNAWRECHTAVLEREGGTLARRSTGGGAVYHDLGNLNFSFIVPRADYDVARQLSVVLRAVQSVGISAVASGRNDLLADGRKFSGNAFRLLKDAALHHGTILVSSDMSLVARYLNVGEDKLKMKGVKSVPARVVNLSALGTVDIGGMRQAMIDAFRAEYGDAEVERAEDIDIDGQRELIEKYRRWDWNYGASPVGAIHLTHRFEWGGVELYGDVEKGCLTHVQVYTDAMDETLGERLTEALKGCEWRGEALAERMREIGEADVAGWLGDV